MGVALLFTACTQLRRSSEATVPEDHDPQATDTVDEEDDDASPSDASTKPDVKDTDSGKDGSAPVSCDGPCPPELIVDGLSQATALTVDATNVYVAVEGNVTGNVYQCPKTGCASPIELGQGYTRSIVVANGVVYWGDFTAGKVQSCAIGGCNKVPTAVVAEQLQIAGVVGDGTDLFWATRGDIKRCSRGTCSTTTAQTITTGESVSGKFAAGLGKILWANGPKGTVYACPAGPCTTPTSLGPGTHDVSVHAGTAYWVNGAAKTVVSCAISGCNGSPHTIGSSQEPASPVSDGTHVYWRDALLDQVYRCPIAGCSPGPEILASNQRAQGGGQIAVDDEYVYWTTTKAVRRLRK